MNDPGIDRVQQLLVKHYEEVAHPGAKVTSRAILQRPEQPPDAQYATAAAAGTLADVLFTADLYVVPFAQQGITIDMQPLADADPTFDLSDVYPNMLDLGKVGDGPVHDPVVVRRGHDVLQQDHVRGGRRTAADGGLDLGRLHRLLQDHQGEDRQLLLRHGRAADGQ